MPDLISQVILPNLHLRSPKLLAPIERRPSDTVVLPELSYRVPLKPISGSALCSRTRLRRERLTWGSQRTGAPRGGSEDSGSSSSSIDLEAEEEDERTLCDPASEENQFKHAGEHYPDSVRFAESDAGSWCFDVQSRARHVPPILTFTLGPDADSMNRASEHFDSERDRKLNCEASDTDYAKEPNDRQLLMKCNNFNEDDTTINERTINPLTESKRSECQTTEPKTEIRRDATYNLNHDQVFSMSSSKGLRISDRMQVKLDERSLKDCGAHNSTPCGRKIASQTVHKRNQSNVAAVPLPQSEISPTREEQTLKVRRITTCRRKANIQADPQSINIQANKDQSIPNRNLPKSHTKKTSPSLPVKDKTRKNPGLIINRDKSCTRVKEKLKVVKGSQCDDGHVHSRRANPASLGTAGAQKHQAVKELAGGQLSKRPGLAGKPRPQSAVDFITYKDMFQKIQSSDKGPAIYEMFAGPVYDNLRGSCDKVKVRQVQSAKVAHTLVKKAPRTAALVKGKPKPAPSRMKSHLQASSKIGTHKKPSGTKHHGLPEAESPHSEHEDGKMLSTIEESLAGHGTVMLKSSEKTHPEEAALVPSDPAGSRHVQVQDTNENSSAEKQNRSPAPSFAQASQQLKINTWTLSRSSEIHPMSPVYKKFLDEIGDSPFTDDLLQCLAEELISLDERDTSLDPCPAMLEAGQEKPYRDDAPPGPRFSEVHSFVVVFFLYLHLVCKHIVCGVFLRVFPLQPGSNV